MQIIHMNLNLEDWGTKVLPAKYRLFIALPILRTICFAIVSISRWKQQ